jgi:hypothetical protein
MLLSFLLAEDVIGIVLTFLKEMAHELPILAFLHVKDKPGFLKLVTGIVGATDLLLHVLLRNVL